MNDIVTFYKGPSQEKTFPLSWKTVEEHITMTPYVDNNLAAVALGNWEFTWD